MYLGVVYQEKLFRISKTLTALMVASVLLLPYSVWLYERGGYEYGMNAVQTVGWERTAWVILHRELAFEVFAIVKEKAAGDQANELFGILGEFREIVPRFLWPDKPDRINFFASLFMHSDLVVAFARYFLTPFYLAYGIPGCCLATFAMGFLYGLGYRKSVNYSLAIGSAWPLIIYSIWTVGARGVVNAGVGVAIPTLMAMTSMMMAILGASYLFRPGSMKTYN